MDIENCDITGMKINGIPIEKLLALYNKVKVNRNVDKLLANLMLC